MVGASIGPGGAGEQPKRRRTNAPWESGPEGWCDGRWETVWGNRSGGTRTGSGGASDLPVMGSGLIELEPVRAEPVTNGREGIPPAHRSGAKVTPGWAQERRDRRPGTGRSGARPGEGHGRGRPGEVDGAGRGGGGCPARWTGG